MSTISGFSRRESLAPKVGSEDSVFGDDDLGDDLLETDSQIYDSGAQNSRYRAPETFSLPRRTADQYYGRGDYGDPASPPPQQRPTERVSHPAQQNTTPIKRSRAVLAIDYGTTFTGITFAVGDTTQMLLDDMKVMVNWTPKMMNQYKARSVISYEDGHRSYAQWGTDVSINAITMINTKMELEQQKTKYNELELIFHVLEGAGNLSFEHVLTCGTEPAYTYKSPTQIVTDYLGKIYKCVCERTNIQQLAGTKADLDIVVTVPVGWSYSATESTFKAIRGAGFNKENFPTLKDTILITEPEAATYFTVRDLEITGNQFLKVGDCFVLCDAGGGTVDVVSYQVKRLQPSLQLEKASSPQSGKCGSSYIDAAFKHWLRDAIGVNHFNELDPGNSGRRLTTHTRESGPMRELIKTFEYHKQKFSNEVKDIIFDLPDPLSNLQVDDRVNAGALTIPYEEMKREIMDPCICAVIELIDQQIKHIGESKARQVKNVFLVGGFGESPYLQEELKESLDLRRIKLRRPGKEKSWTAVVQGAAIYGIEKARHPVTYMSAVTSSYGIVLDDRFNWLVRQEDLVLSNEKKVADSSWFWIPLAACQKYKYELQVYSYTCFEKDDQLPKSWQFNKNEVEKFSTVECDFSALLTSGKETRRQTKDLLQQIYRKSDIGPLRCQMRMSSTHLEVLVYHRKTVIASSTIQIPAERQKPSSADPWQESDYY